MTAFKYTPPSQRPYTPRWTSVDPRGCGCTDCLVGESIPADCLSPKDREWIVAGNEFDDRSCYTINDWDDVLAHYLPKDV